MTTTRIFHSFALFDGVNPQVRPDCWLEVADGCIQRVGEGPHPQSDEMVDLGGRTVIPGLIDARTPGLSFHDQVGPGQHTCRFLADEAQPGELHS